MLAFSVFMLLIAENIPATSERVPLIEIYLTITMSLTSTSIILTVFVLQLHHGSQFELNLSRRFYDVVTKRIAYIVGLRQTVRNFELKNQMKKEDQIQLNKKLSHSTSNAHVLNSPKTGCESARSPRTQIKEIKTYNSTANFSQNYSQCLLASSATELHINKLNFEVHPYYAKQLSSLSKNMNSNCGEKCADTRCLKSHRRSLKIKEIKKKQSMQEMKKKVLIGEWKLVSLIIDRFLFWIFTMLTLVSSALILLIIPVLKNKEII